MKGYALNGRHKQKDAYNVYYCVRNYPAGSMPWQRLASPCSNMKAASGAANTSRMFDAPEGYGATSVRKFVAETEILDGRTPEQWQQDAFGQADAWLRALGLR